MARLPLTDQLAVDRTRLAIERTWLAFVRTSLGLVAAGGTVLHFRPDPIGFVVGGGLLVAGGAVGAWGSIRARHAWNDLNRLAHHGGAEA